MWNSTKRDASLNEKRKKRQCKVESIQLYYQLHTSAQPAAQILFTALSFEFCTPVTSWSCPKGEEKICYKCRVFSAQPFIWRNIMRSTRCSRWNVLADKQNRKVICNSAASAQMPSVALSTMVRGRLLMLMRRFATGADLFNLITLPWIQKSACTVSLVAWHVFRRTTLPWPKAKAVAKARPKPKATVQARAARRRRQ